jgi:membrane associated rhomboid family serine protease
MLRNIQLFRLMPVTLVLIAVSVLIALASSFGRNIEMLLPFFMSEYVGGGLREIMQGQLWRLITPIFIHFGLIHILFNMLWMFDLGGVIERMQGSPRIGVLVGVTGVAGNLAQYLWGGPNFGGMSGVVYGLLGYVWIQGRLNPGAGLVLHQHIVIMMLAWFALCWAGVIGSVANMAHTMGLVSGLALGWIYSPNKRF